MPSNLDASDAASDGDAGSDRSIRRVARSAASAAMAAEPSEARRARKPEETGRTFNARHRSASGSISPYTSSPATPMARSGKDPGSPSCGRGSVSVTVVPTSGAL